jgi:hypothetical protein
MVDATGQPQPTRPGTLWEACLSGAGLLAGVGAREAPGEVLLPEEELVAVLIAAGMYQQLQRRSLDGDVDEVRRVWLQGEDGLVSTLHRAAYSALENAPADGISARERQLLLAEGAAAHPDRRRHWEQVRFAAVDAVKAASREAVVPENEPRSVELADVIDSERRRRHLAALEDHFGTEAY